MFIKYANRLKWMSTAMFLIAATLLSSNIEISRYGFFLFLFAHIILSVLFWIARDKPLFVQNFFFIFIDAFGIYRWFLV